MTFSSLRKGELRYYKVCQRPIKVVKKLSKNQVPNKIGADTYAGKKLLPIFVAGLAIHGIFYRLAWLLVIGYFRLVID